MLFPSYTGLLYVGPVDTQNTSPPRSFGRTTVSLKRASRWPAALRPTQPASGPGAANLPSPLQAIHLGFSSRAERTQRTGGDHSLTPLSSELTHTQKSVLTWTML